MVDTRRGVLRSVTVGSIFGLSGCIWQSDAVDWDTVSPQPFTEDARSLTPAATFGGPEYSDAFGHPIATTGEEVFVGAHTATVGESKEAGSVYVFKRIDGQWQQTKVLAGNGSEWEWFGHQVAADESTLLVKCGDTQPNTSRFQVRVFEPSSDGRWRQTATTGVFDNIEAMATDGQTAAVIAPSRDDPIQVYRKGHWNEPATIETSGPTSGRAFRSVAVDGQTILVGSTPIRTAESRRAKKGAVHVFERSDDGWSKQTTLTGPPGEDDFGTSVAIAEKMALIGDDGNHSAHVFTRTGGSWVHKQMYTATVDDHSQRFGRTVAMDSDTLLVGAPYGEVDGAVYELSARTETPRGTYFTAPETSRYFGYRVDTAENTTVIVGGPSVSELTVYIYNL